MGEPRALQSVSHCSRFFLLIPPLPPTETFHLHFPVAVSKACCPRGMLIIMKVKVLLALQCRTLYNPADCSLSGSSVHGTSQARTLEWVAFPSPGDLPDPGTEPGSLALQADSLPSESTGKPNNTPVLLPGKSHGQRSLVG